MTLVLLSVLLAASTASVRISYAASTPVPETTPEPSQAVVILGEACVGANALSGDSAAYAAEMLRWEAGFISRTSQNSAITKTQRIAPMTYSVVSVDSANPIDVFRKNHGDGHATS